MVVSASSIRQDYCMPDVPSVMVSFLSVLYIFVIQVETGCDSLFLCDVFC